MSATTERIFSGIQPTGRKHLGNYIGAIRQYVAGHLELVEGAIREVHAEPLEPQPRAECTRRLRASIPFGADRGR